MHVWYRICQRASAEETTIPTVQQMWFSQKCMYLFTISAITPVYTLQAQVTICRQVVASTQSYAWIDSACNRLVLEIPDTHTHTNGLQQAHNRFPAKQTCTQILCLYMSMKSSSKASDTCFFSFFPMFLFNSQAAGHPRDAARWKGVPVSSSKPRSCGTSWGLEWVSSMASWLESHEVVGKHGKTWENNHGNHEILETSGELFLVCVFVCAFFIPDYSWSNSRVVCEIKTSGELQAWLQVACGSLET